MALALISFRLFLAGPEIRREVIGHRHREFDVNEDGVICEVEYERFLETLRSEWAGERE